MDKLCLNLKELDNNFLFHFSIRDVLAQITIEFPIKFQQQKNNCEKIKHIFQKSKTKKRTEHSPKNT